MAGRVVVCDDAMFMRAMVANALRGAGHEIVAEVGTGAAAVAAYAEHRPDLVTMDVVMPGMGGIEAVRAIMAADPHARVVMVSAVGQESLVAEAIAAGARGFVQKPFDTAELVARVAAVLADVPAATGTGQ